MPGGKYHLPIWKPYALYGTIDYVYGWPAWDSHSGFTAAQASLNVVETIMYFYYLAVIWQSSAKDLYVFGNTGTLFWGNHEKVISGPGIAKAVLVLFSALVMTISKTALYCKCLLLWFSSWGLSIHLSPLPDTVHIVLTLATRAQRILFRLCEHWP